MHRLIDGWMMQKVKEVSKIKRKVASIKVALPNRFWPGYAKHDVTQSLTFKETLKGIKYIKFKHTFIFSLAMSRLFILKSKIQRK